MNQRARHRESPDSGATARAKWGAERPWASTSQRILVVDSDTTVADSVAGALRIAGHVVDTAGTRTAALALMERHRYGLVVSDLTMTDLNGPTLYDELARRFPRVLPRVIFIAQSAFSPKYSTFLMEVGVPLLRKPVSPAALWDSVECLLGRHRV